MNKQSRSGPAHKKTMKQRKKETRKQTEKLRKIEWLETSKSYRKWDTAGSVSKFDTSKLKGFHNTV